MTWLAALDARAKTWSRPIRWSYLGVRWYLLLGGMVLVVGLAFTEIREKRVGLGTGVVTVVLFGVIKGVLSSLSRYFRRDRDSQPF